MSFKVPVSSPSADSVRLYNFAKQKIFPAYQNVEDLAAVMVAGSVALGNADKFSDLELVFYWKQPPTPQERLAPPSSIPGCQVANDGYFAEGKCYEEKLVFFVNGQEGSSKKIPIKVDCMHFNLDDIKSKVVAFYERQSYATDVQIALFWIHNGLYLKGENEYIKPLREVCSHFPQAIQEAIIKDELKEIYQNWRREVTVARDDFFFLQKIVLESLRQVFKLLYAINCQVMHCSDFKRLSWIAANQLTIKPHNFLRKVENSLFLLANNFMLGIQELENLVYETMDLIEFHVPSLSSLAVDTRKHLSFHRLIPFIVRNSNMNSSAQLGETLYFNNYGYTTEKNYSIENLSDKILLKILAFLGSNDVRAVAQSSRRMYRVYTTFKNVERQFMDSCFHRFSLQTWMHVGWRQETEKYISDTKALSTKSVFLPYDVRHNLNNIALFVNSIFTPEQLLKPVPVHQGYEVPAGQFVVPSKLDFIRALNAFQKTSFPLSDEILLSFDDAVFSTTLVAQGKASAQGRVSMNLQERVMYAAKFKDAFEYIKSIDPALHYIMNKLTTVIICHVKKPGAIYSGGSLSNMVGAIWLTPSPTWTVLDYVDRIIHEYIHNVLHIEDMLNGVFVPSEELLNTEDAMIKSTFRQVKRPFDYSIHAAYVSTGLSLFLTKTHHEFYAKKYASDTKEVISAFIYKADTCLTEYGRFCFKSLVDSTFVEEEAEKAKILKRVKLIKEFEEAAAKSGLSRCIECANWLKERYILNAPQEELFPNPTQKPLVLFPGITAKPLHNPEIISWKEDIESVAGTIKQELLELLNKESAKWKRLTQTKQTKLPPQGTWEIFTLFEEHKPYEPHAVLCPKTMEVIQQIVEKAGIETNKKRPIEYAGFFHLGPKSKLQPHCSSTNLRLRIHLGLVVPKNCKLVVSNVEQEWTEGKIFILDDSFEHYAYNDSEEDRYIFLMDLWHPELKEEELNLVGDFINTFE